jgi:hypothetical protein
MGLAKSELSTQGVLTPVESLAKAGTIKAVITTFKISRLADQKNDGQVTIGGLDQSLFDPATLVTIPNVNTQGFWEGAVDAITVNGADTGLTGRTAILDTVSKYGCSARNNNMADDFFRAQHLSLLLPPTPPPFMPLSPVLNLTDKADSRCRARQQHLLL